MLQKSVKGSSGGLFGPGPLNQGIESPGPAAAEQSGRVNQTVCRCCLRASQGDAGAARNPKARPRCVQARPADRAFCLSPEGKPSGRRPKAALPRRTDNEKVSRCAQNVVAKRDLPPAALARRFVIPTHDACQAARRMQNMVAIKPHNTNETKNHPRRPRARRRNAASPDTLAYPGKSREQPIGKSLLFPGGFPGFSGCPGTVLLSRAKCNSGTQLGSNC